ncbi:Prenyltransferase and squalene oxidase repeat-containing protein [Thermomonospora echinospora]|uniref:Prenyltransferase and squalene oxidase repeat-containing protein n=1 Tax=Thermomonospora echinospora TaxID=1992 RepID=A0A1H6D4Z2_9ACTN|nr:prenyltransferase/squalene oxidase repeat-containing protein [Thermomonospora echinospora]SEG80124.1 Prenyltransferase and squalene oxidase repeat-containing protein [Thermomonospora echinospora]
MIASETGRRPVPTSGPGARTVQLDLVLLDEDGENVAVHDRYGRLTCPRLTVAGPPPDGRELGTLVRELAAGQLDLDVDHLGLLAAEETGPTVRLVVAAVLRARPDDARLRLLPVTDLRSRRRDLQYPAHFDTARSWHQAARNAPELGRRIERSLYGAVAFLERRRAEEAGHWGWEQYLEQRDSIGTMSTALGLLACLHTGRDRYPGTWTDRMLQTLRDMQNPDGGWQIKWALVGGTTDVSITESTCACLWAFYEAGRGPGEDEAVRRGLQWLQEQQRPGGGWPSAAVDQRSLVFPTASAVRILALYGYGEAAARGVQWLRGAQCPDGGWGATPAVGDETVSSSPAYTAATLLALRRAGVPASERVVVAGCEYLLGSFSPDRAEPWESTSFTSVVDAERFARMDFRHFATPWALAALCECGYDLSHPVILTGTLQLLRLERPGGGWRSTLTAPDITPVWAVHGAVYGLRTVLDSSVRDLAPLVLARHHEAERRTLARLSGELVGRHAEPGRPPHVWRRRMTTVWLALLTVAVALLVLGQLGVLQALQSDSGQDKILAGLATLVVTVGGALVPSVLVEEYRIRRSRGRAGGDREIPG